MSDQSEWMQITKNQSEVESEGHATCVKRGKTRNLLQARENTKTVASAGKHVNWCKRGKSYNLC